MNGVTKDLMQILRIDENTALQVQAEMDSSGIDYSECTWKEFKETAAFCHQQVTRRMFRAAGVQS